jgi:hypothetical protein
MPVTFAYRTILYWLFILWVNITVVLLFSPFSLQRRHNVILFASLSTIASVVHHLPYHHLWAHDCLHTVQHGPKININ